MDHLPAKYPSQSEADFALLNRLAYQAMRLNCPPHALASTVLAAFERSGLYRAEKRNRIVTQDLPRLIPKVLEWSNNKALSANPIPSEIIEANRRFAFIEGFGIYDKERNRFITTEQFRLFYANRFVNIGTSDKPQRVTLDRLWLSAADRSQFTALELAPGQPERTASGALNTYNGFAVTPADGDVSIFLELLKHLIPDPDERSFFIAFLAYKTQNPGARYSVAAVLWSQTQGVGKNLVTETWARIFHQDHVAVRGQEVFDDQFTDWRHRRLVCILDEISSTDRRTVADRIKGWITASVNVINTKNQPKLDETNLIAHIFLSNHPDAVYINDADRRFWVCECTSKRPQKELIERFVAWREGGGLAHLLFYFLHYDAGEFDPRAAAPMTRSKREMIEDNRSDLERWLSDFLSADNVSLALGRDLVTAEDLVSLYRERTSKAASTKALNNALQTLGIRRLPKQARRSNGARPRVYALGNQQAYSEMTDSQLGEVLDQRETRLTPVSGFSPGPTSD